MLKYVDISTNINTYFNKFHRTFQPISTLLILQGDARAGSARASHARAGRGTSRGWAGGWTGHNLSVGEEAREPAGAALGARGG